MDEGQPRRAIPEAMARLLAMLAAVAGVCMLGLVTVPVGRPAAYLVLVATLALVSRRWGWEVGVASALAATIVFMWAHGRPRFQTIIADVTIIRLGWLLLLFGLAAAWLGERRLRRIREAADAGRNEGMNARGGNLVA